MYINCEQLIKRGSPSYPIKKTAPLAIQSEVLNITLGHYSTKSVLRLFKCSLLCPITAT